MQQDAFDRHIGIDRGDLFHRLDQPAGTFRVAVVNAPQKALCFKYAARCHIYPRAD
jgi:hypothetical protein